MDMEEHLLDTRFTLEIKLHPMKACSLSLITDLLEFLLQYVTNLFIDYVYREYSHSDLCTF